MRFNVVLTNPPFHDVTRRGKTPHKLWIDFTRAIVERFLIDGGVLAQVSPSSFQSPNSPVLALMKAYRTPLIRLDTGHHFPRVGSTFADYIIYKEPRNGEPTEIRANGQAFRVDFDRELFYIPNDLTPEGISIHRKVMFRPIKKLPVEWDYVTCHNIRTRDGSGTLSRSRTDTHIFPVFHTNSQVWWSSIRQEWADQTKVIWTRSGYTRPFYDPGQLGGTDMAYFVRVLSDDEGINLAHNMNLALMQYIYRTAKWSGYGNERVFAALPDLPRDRRLSDAELFRLFGVTEREIRHLYQVRLPEPAHPDHVESALWFEIENRMSEHQYMAGIDRTSERVSTTAEVFTPTQLVLEILRSIPLGHFARGNVVLDPACGDGQFLVAAKWIKVLHHRMTEEDAVSELFGVDIMRDNADLCQRRLGGGTIAMGDILKPETVLPGQSAVDREWMKRTFTTQDLTGSSHADPSATSHHTNFRHLTRQERGLKQQLVRVARSSHVRPKARPSMEQLFQLS